MGMRLLTKKFTGYNIAKCEKRFHKDFMDFLDIGNLSISKILNLIQMGNNDCEEQEAGRLFDNYLADPNHGVIDAYLQVLDELNSDTKILKGTGITIDKLREEFNRKMGSSVNDAEITEGTTSNVQAQVFGSVKAEAPVEQAVIEQFPTPNVQEQVFGNIETNKEETPVQKVDINGYVPTT